MSVSQGPYTFI